jgi:hypothetical protein
VGIDRQLLLVPEGLLGRAQGDLGPRLRELRLLTTASTPGMPKAAAPPDVMSAWVAPEIR